MFSLGQNPVVGNEPNNVADLLLLQIAIARGNGKPGIRPEQDQCSGIGFVQLFDQSCEHCQSPVGGVCIAGTQHRCQGKAGAPVKDEERVIHMLFVVTMEEFELLLAVSGIIGGVLVDNDHLPGDLDES
jgi:hypothetical protein